MENVDLLDEFEAVLHDLVLHVAGKHVELFLAYGEDETLLLSIARVFLHLQLFEHSGGDLGLLVFLKLVV